MIKCSAVKFVPFGTDYPIIVAGPRHPDCYETIQEHFGHSYLQSPDIVEGFLDEMDRFLDRYDAKYEALRCGQLTHDTSDRALYSEDIWPEE